MGMFDTIRVGGREGQVKCWTRSMLRYDRGSEVPQLDGVLPEPADRTYSIAMREGGYVNICDRLLISWEDEPRFVPVVDKYGDLYMGVDAHGPLDGVAGIRDKYVVDAGRRHGSKP